PKRTRSNGVAGTYTLSSRGCFNPNPVFTKDPIPGFTEDPNTEPVSSTSYLPSGSNRGNAPNPGTQEDPSPNFGTQSKPVPNPDSQGKHSPNPDKQEKPAPNPGSPERSSNDQTPIPSFSEEP
ncbi:2044_t:CDS:1, partial [Racocetra fulgida]